MSGFFKDELSRKTSIFGLKFWVVLGICLGATIVIIIFFISLFFTFKRKKAFEKTITVHQKPKIPNITDEIQQIRVDPTRTDNNHKQPQQKQPENPLTESVSGSLAIVRSNATEDDNSVNGYEKIQIEIGKGHRILYPERGGGGSSYGSGSGDQLAIMSVQPEVSHLGWGHWYTLRELEIATNGFSDENVIGEGGYGIVYSGVLPDDTMVAVKNLLNNRGQAEKEFKVEVEAIGRVRHKNLVRLLGYCAEGAQRILVYEYVNNGNLEQWLHGDVGPISPLTWEIRMNIVLAFYSATLTVKPDVFANYRRLKDQAVNDYVDLTSLSVGVSKLKEVKLCGREREHYVPCYNVSANLLSGFRYGDEFDRHCEVSKGEPYCLVRPPKDYKTPLSWPVGRDVIWNENVKITKDQFLSSGSMTKRLMLMEENQISFHSDDGVKDYSHQVAEMIGLGNDVEFYKAGVRTVLDVGCGFGSFGAHLLSLKLMTVCMAAYELTGSQVQISLERGLPAVIGNFNSRQLPFPCLSYDMVHCAECGILWDDKDGLLLIEADRILKPGGYFVLHGNSLSTKKGSTSRPIEEFARKICWTFVAQEEETFIWQKTIDPQCYLSSIEGVIPPCREEREDIPSYYQPLASCVGGTTSKRWVSVQNRSSGSQITPAALEIYGIQQDEFFEDFESSLSALRNYWSLLTPLIFSDHPKRPGDEDPLPPYNMIRNVMDMNARYGGLNAAFLEEGKAVWVMNVVPIRARNTLPVIFDQGFAGVLHDWCEPFPTYPRTYDMLHANGLLSYLISERCSITNLLLEMDRILRPEGWVVLSDDVGSIEKARSIATQIRWEARVIDLENGSDQRILVCQKPFVRR